MEKTVKELAVPSIAYLVSILLTVWFLVLQHTTIPLTFLGIDQQVNLTFLGLPLTVLLVFRYIALVIEKLLVGEIITPLANGLRTISITGFLYLLSNWSTFPLWLRPITEFLIYTSLLSVLHNLVIEILNDINQLFEPIITSIYILFVGYISSNTWLAMYPNIAATLSTMLSDSLTSILQSGLAEPINYIIILSTVLTSAFTLTGLGANHPNSYLRFMSKTVGENISKVMFLNFAFFFYIFFVRNFLFKYSGINPQFITIAEWLLICGTFYLGYQNLKSYAETALVIEDVTGTWRKHFQQVETISDPQLELLSRLIEGFIDNSLRDDLVTHLTVLLTESGMALNQVSQINGLLIGHQDTKPPRIGFPWQIAQHKRFDKQRRKQIVDTVLSLIRIDPTVSS
ncbi:hypothetical protein HN807_02400 [Candidatus Bathyarchaeota archaeon]|jgi:hypothetical protein|nr:hypothetical protein [Candidatus Bathyarchaeota archaeon]MBT6603854.1 hypothetical protein [Candidatus Bathyarchaeota archaeon]MBT7187028.1 hypothetical protein [Candidatus Bathyarchaeota archaeon]MBT7345917.1 hypothetical protein [Candidatus Bathyarchaeota archaeon]MBT7915176.1 hypothetical protein [Candidatus Bathyarchaeota archaeon]